MYFKLFESENGEYQDKQGKTYNLISCSAAYTPDGLNEGWDYYPSLKAALKAFGLKANPAAQE